MKYPVWLLLLTLVVGCNQKSKFKTDSKDYELYLSTASNSTTSKYFELWNNKIKPDSLQALGLGNVAAEYSRFFTGTGNITYLKKAEEALSKAVEVAAIGKAAYYRALARNYISQHRFKEALTLAELALKKGSGVNASHGLLFDLHMELGNYNTASKYLDSIRNMSDFGYLIRLAKWNDYKGNLDTTIRLMEKAINKAESSKNRQLMLWSYTNLADYYGHAGRIQESYEHYLKALKIDSKNAYAKKGIAWIVFSHEKDGAEALRILNAITQTHTLPDYHLLRAEIAEFMNDDALKKSALNAYHKSIQDKSYGAMYNAYTINLYLDELQAFDRALELAKKEVENRPTPESFDMLAYSYLKKGEPEVALELAQNHVVGKTQEPVILQHLAEIYKANGKTKEVQELKKELLEALYELGPNASKKVGML
ncbi:hypothetical protein LV716_14415 [Flagellimonas sp. HMM57]|uniref:tetratricopeptide repeat protein n=1 Tax=unclassified Flagellimonas TaxID=2644544 RepID=UPI0013D5C635|nr:MULTISPECIES: hypothetical protein [unclassified Flagellimonas]UII75443.1 hypothetical protein LV716_14415 [Flagellimonas sp. HMM57]